MTRRRGAVGEKRHKQSERGLDLYETPEVATLAIIQAEPKLLLACQHIWEPACGRGAIVKVLRRKGFRVTGTDIAGKRSVDFLKIGPPVYEWPFDLILTNPPFHLAQEFVEHALKIAPHVIMLLRLAFLESERRSPILDGGQLRRVHVFRRRLPMMHRDGWKGPRTTSMMAFAWFVWDRTYCGPTELRRI